MIRKVLVPLSENKADQMSIGRFSFGLALALNHLSNGQPVTIMSKHTDGDYIKVILDFNPRSMYDPTPVIMEMDERTSFTSKVPETGTIITIAYNDDIIQSITSQFDSISKSPPGVFESLDDTWAAKIGSIPIQVKLDIDGDTEKILEPYDPFGQPSTQFYNGKKARDIILYEYPNGDVIPVTETSAGEYAGFKKPGVNCGTKISEIRDIDRANELGIIVMQYGLFKHPDIFDSNNPKLPTAKNANGVSTGTVSYTHLTLPTKA